MDAEAISCKTFVPYDNSAQSIFCASASLLRLGAKVLPLAAPTGFEPAISALTGPHVSRYTTGPVVERAIVYHGDSDPSRQFWQIAQVPLDQYFIHIIRSKYTKRRRLPPTKSHIFYRKLNNWQLIINNIYLRHTHNQPPVSLPLPGTQHIYKRSSYFLPQGVFF